MSDSLPAEAPGRPRRRRLAWTVAAAVLVAAGACVQLTNPHGVSLWHPLGIAQQRAAAAPDNGAATTTQTVARRSLSQTTSVPGTLGYAGEYTVLGQGNGTVTWLPPVGSVIRQGRALYRFDGRPVVLLYGSSPSYRVLAEGVTAGHDIAQLNHDLVALGYLDKSAVIWALG